MSINLSQYRDKLLFVPLGGSNEIGMNLNLYHVDGKWLMVDLGIGFAGEYLPGVDVVVPDISFIVEHKQDLVGLVITHAHEDHLGAVPYLWRELGCPIYATPFTASLLKLKFAEMGPGAKPSINIMQPGAKWSLGKFDLEYIALTHSIPEMQAVAIRTPHGVVLHTGDWKFDPNPLLGPVSDEATLKRLGDEGVLAMVCDSTNVFVDGESGSEEPVRRHLTDLIREQENRVVVTTFASNVARLESIIKAGHETGRVIGLAGRSLWRMVQAAQESGYLTGDYEFVSDREIMNIPRRDMLLITTGCQGEQRAALTRIARGDHPTIRLSPGDTVIFASRRIPGNEARIGWVMNQLVRKRVEVITDREYYIHVSGHPAREELKHMYRLVRPKIAIPTHGEARHLHEHALLARSMGVKETVEASNGAVLELVEGDAAVVGQVKSGYQAIDGLSLIPTDGSIIRTRRKLRDDGCVFASVAVSRDGKLETAARVVAPGVIDAIEDEELMAECAAVIEEAVESAKPRAGDEQIAELIRLSLRKFFKHEIDKKPVIEVHVLRV